MSDQSSLLAPRRSDLSDREALRRMREELFQASSLGVAISSLFAVGYTEGRIDGLRVLQGFEGRTVAGPLFAGPALPLLPEPECTDLSSAFTTRLPRSVEAELHREGFPPSGSPICFVSAGYAAGWFSEVLGESVLVREVRCRARGDGCCTFDVRSISAWQEAADPFMTELLSSLDLPRLAERAREVVRATSEEDVEGSMLGQFDPLSPAAHVWGPVMILPYSGAEDGEDAIESIEGDIGPGQVRVVIVDLTGARINPLEASGLARVLDRVEAMGAEAIIVGLKRGDTPPFRESESGLAMPIIARDLPEAIALGFQMCQTPRGTSS